MQNLKKTAQQSLLSFIRLTDKHWYNTVILTILISGLVGLMVIRGWANTCYVLLFIIAMLNIKPSVNHFRQERLFESSYWIFFALCLPILALFFSQLGRQDWLISAYDGPSRMLFALPILLYFAHLKLDFVNVLGIAIPLLLLATIVSIHQHPEVITFWGGRYATTFVDPNSFGNFTVIFTAFCWFNLDVSVLNTRQAHSGKTKIWFLYQLIGLMAGLYLVLGSGTRGSWLAIPVIAMIWFALHYRELNIKFLGLISLVAMGGFVFTLLFFPQVFERFVSGFTEISRWFHHENLDTSAGIRLSMWHIAWDLYSQRPLLGYGDHGFQDYLNASFINSEATQVAKDTIRCCGPHNELLANMLRSGFLGILSIASLFLVPLAFFVRHVRHVNPKVKLAAQLGLVYIVTLIICSLSMEVFNLKYTSSFYGLMMAGLFAQILSTRQDKPHSI